MAHVYAELPVLWKDVADVLTNIRHWWFGKNCPVSALANAAVEEIINKMLYDYDLDYNDEVIRSVVSADDSCDHRNITVLEASAENENAIATAVQLILAAANCDKSVTIQITSVDRDGHVVFVVSANAIQAYTVDDLLKQAGWEEPPVSDSEMRDVKLGRLPVSLANEY